MSDTRKDALIALRDRGCRCENCKSWKRHEPMDAGGFCRKHGSGSAMEDEICTDWSAIMTVHREALTALRDKVRTGTAIEADFAEAWPHAHNSEHHRAWLAYLGSLDAAKQLHDAVLRPGDWYSIEDGLCELCAGGKCFDAKVSGNSARAWLIAILSALIAQAQP